MHITIFHGIWKIWDHYFCKYSFCSFFLSGDYYCAYISTLMIFLRSLFIFLHVLFSFSFSDLKISFDPFSRSLVLSSVSSCCSAPLLNFSFGFSLVKSSLSVMSDSLSFHGPQHVRPPCPSPNSGVYPNSGPLSWWCHPTISSSVIPCSSWPQTLPASGFFSNESVVCIR